MLRPGVGDPLVDLVHQRNDVVLLAEVADGGQLVAGEDLSWIKRKRNIFVVKFNILQMAKQIRIEKKS